jgi:hypothetical protein
LACGQGFTTNILAATYLSPRPILCQWFQS